MQLALWMNDFEKLRPWQYNIETMVDIVILKQKKLR